MHEPLGIERQVARVVAAPVATDPRRPPETSVAAEARLRHPVAPQDESRIPFELEVEICTHPGDEPLHRLTAGKECLVLGERERTEPDADLVLAVPDALAERRPLAEQSVPIADAHAGLLGLRQGHPVPHELLDARRYAEVAPQERTQPLRTPMLTREQSGVEELCPVGDRVAVTHARGADAHERADVVSKAVLPRPVEVDRRLRLRPRAIEHGEETVVKDIEKARECWVLVMEQPVTREFGEVQRKRTVGTEEPEERDL